MSRHLKASPLPSGSISSRRAGSAYTLAYWQAGEPVDIAQLNIGHDGVRVLDLHGKHIGLFASHDGAWAYVRRNLPDLLTGRDA